MFKRLTAWFAVAFCIWLLALPAEEAGAWYLPNIDQMRLVNLSKNFARWVQHYFHS